MQVFEFLTAGIHVVFRGEHLFLSSELLREFEDKYVGRVSERTMLLMLVVAQNVEALRERAKMWGGFGASFNTWTTFLPTDCLGERWKEVVRNSHIYLRRVRKATGGCIIGVEWGGRGGRVHGHFVSDRWMSVKQQGEAKGWRNSLMGRCHMCDLGARPGYMWKEMGKAVGRRGTGMRLMGNMGEFAGRCSARDIVMDSPMAECRRRMWAMRERRGIGRIIG